MIKKFNFIPEAQLNQEPSESEGYSVRITKEGSIYFSSSVVKMFDLEGKIIRFYADTEKKSIAWTEVKNGDLSILKGVRVMKPTTPESKFVILGIGKLLKNIGITKEMLPVRYIPVTTYKDLLVAEPFSVIDLKPHYDEFMSESLKHKKDE